MISCDMHEDQRVINWAASSAWLRRRKWKVKEAFKRLDLNQTGTLDVDELSRIAAAVVPFEASADQLRYFRCGSSIWQDNRRQEAAPSCAETLSLSLLACATNHSERR
jgi:hypothetical protein